MVIYHPSLFLVPGSAAWCNWRCADSYYLRWKVRRGKTKRVEKMEYIKFLVVVGSG